MGKLLRFCNGAFGFYESCVPSVNSHRSQLAFSLALSSLFQLCCVVLAILAWKAISYTGRHGVTVYDLKEVNVQSQTDPLVSENVVCRLQKTHGSTYCKTCFRQ